MRKAVIIIQARMRSIRLPGKVLMPIGPKPILQHVIERCRESNANEVVVATTEHSADSSIVAMCHKMGTLCYRGSEEDVLSRYVETAKIVEADAVIRITADCPLMDPDVINAAIEKLNQMPFLDYVSNTIRRTFPRGLDVELMWVDVLNRIGRMSLKAKEKEHVTWLTRSRPDLFERYSLEDIENNSDLRWTVDTATDLLAVRAVYDCGSISLRDRVIYARSHPFCTVNSNVEQKDA